MLLRLLLRRRRRSKMESQWKKKPVLPQALAAAVDVDAHEKEKVLEEAVEGKQLRQLRYKPRQLLLRELLHLLLQLHL